VGKIRRGGFVFLTWKGDHGSRHVHVYRNGRLVLKWDLENQKPLYGVVSRRVRALLDRLEAEGAL